MQTYELVVVVNPSYDEERREKALKVISDLIVAKGGEVISQDMWGRKTLAYPIKKFTEGVYVMFTFNAPQDQTNDIDYKIKTNEDLIRYILVKKEA